MEKLPNRRSASDRVSTGSEGSGRPARRSLIFPCEYSTFDKKKGSRTILKTSSVRQMYGGNLIELIGTMTRDLAGPTFQRETERKTEFLYDNCYYDGDSIRCLRPSFLPLPIPGAFPANSRRATTTSGSTAAHGSLAPVGPRLCSWRWAQRTAAGSARAKPTHGCTS